MDQEKCRATLSRLITDESSALKELSILLDREHDFLQSDDVNFLEGATRERQRCVARILRVDDERRRLCRDLGRPLDPKGLEDLIRWCDPNGTLAGRWVECSDAATQCRTRNDRNGALVAARLKHVSGRLDILIESRREAVTYGPRGAYGRAASGRVVATEA